MSERNYSEPDMVNAVLIGAFVGIMFGGVIGYVAGTSADTSTQTGQPSTEIPLPNGSVMERTIAATKSDTLVERFCTTKGYPDGYPDVSVNGDYHVRCYGTVDGVDRGEDFVMFEEFADYVAEVDSNE